MSKKDNLKDFLADLYEGIAQKKPTASRNPQDFRAEIDSLSAAPYYDGSVYISTSLITFTIDGHPYQAEEGMTWYDWCGSFHDTFGFQCDDEGVFAITETMIHVSADGTSSTKVIGTDTILHNNGYITYTDD